MYLMSNTCPGRQWRRVNLAFIVCETSGRRIVPGPHQAFWERVI